MHINFISSNEKFGLRLPQEAVNKNGGKKIIVQIVEKLSKIADSHEIERKINNLFK